MFSNKDTILDRLAAINAASTKGTADERKQELRANHTQMRSIIDSSRKGMASINRAPQHTTLTDFAKKVGYTVNEGELCLDLYRDLGIQDLDKIVIADFMSSSQVPDVNWLLSEVVLDIVKYWGNLKDIKNDLVARSRPQVGTLIVPEITEADATPAVIREGEAVSLGTLEFGSRKIRSITVGKGLVMSTSLIQEMRIDAFKEWSDYYYKMSIIARIQATIATIISGDQSNGSRAVSFFGAVTPSSTFSLIWADIAAALTCVKFDTFVVNSNTQVGLMSMPEVMGLIGGTTLIRFSNLNLSGTYKVVTNELIPDNSILFVDTTSCVEELVLSGRTSEWVNDPIKSERTLVIKEGLGYRNLDPFSAVFLNGNLPFTGLPSKLIQSDLYKTSFNYNTFGAI